MTVLDRALSVAGTAKTFAVNFWPWLLGAWLLGVAVAAPPAIMLTKAVYQRQALQCQANAARFEERLASQAATTEREIANAIIDAERRSAARDQATAARVAAIPSEIARQLQPELQRFRSAVNAIPDLATCLQQPMPADALRVLERPGGPFAAADR